MLNNLCLLKFLYVCMCVVKLYLIYLLTLYLLKYRKIDIQFNFFLGNSFERAGSTNISFSSGFNFVVTQRIFISVTKTLNLSLSPLPPKKVV